MTAAVMTEWLLDKAALEIAHYMKSRSVRKFLVFERIFSAVSIFLRQVKFTSLVHTLRTSLGSTVYPGIRDP